jgi:hypothetical protein|tara:strand:+ start:2858 stop:2992 length:135 start_codon:yes stop_codon:yes gene_type:complete
MSEHIKKISIPLGAGLWRSMFARFKDDKIIELAATEEQLKGKDV